MSLSTSDFDQIRTIIQEELEPLDNDVKEVYFMIRKLQGSAITDRQFSKMTIEKKLLTLNVELLAAAKQAGLTLPRL